MLLAEYLFLLWKEKLNSSETILTKEKIKPQKGQHSVSLALTMANLGNIREAYGAKKYDFPGLFHWFEDLDPPLANITFVLYSGRCWSNDSSNADDEHSGQC